MHTIRTYLLYLAGALLPLLAQAQSSHPPLHAPKYEVRAVWLTTIGGLDWPRTYAQGARSMEKQKQELCHILDQLQRAHVNTVLFQTRVRGTLLYDSQMEPWDGCLSGTPGRSPDYDALQFAIDECHRRGMEFQAWVVAIPLGKWNGAGCRRLREQHPTLVKKIGAEGYMNPEQPATGTYLADLCEEITRRYDIDGIHLDYIRYPETWPTKMVGGKGRPHITRIVAEVSRRVKAAKPWVKMSCAPIGKRTDLSRYSSQGWNAYDRVGQDVVAWLRDGLMDEVFPMMYFRDNQFFPFAIDWAEQAGGRIVAPGLGIYFMSPTEKDWSLQTVSREMEVLRRYGLGHAYFRSRFFTDDTKGIYRFACNQFDAHPALVPPMTWACNKQPPMPQGLSLQESPQACVLSWTPTASPNKEDPSGNSPYYYNVYASRTYPVATDDARNLIATRLQQTSIALPPSAGLHYAVTAMNRYGMESHAAQMPITRQPAPNALPLLRVDEDGMLRLPKAIATQGHRHVAVTTMQGKLIRTATCHGGYVDVGSMPKGFYQLRSLGKKGISHRLGFFRIPL